MKINSYTLWESKQSKSSSSNLVGSDDALFIFLRSFPNIEDVFFKTGALTFTPGQEHLDCLESEIKTRLADAEKKAGWKTEWTREKIDFIKRGGHIHKIKFQGNEFEVNTFGQSENGILLEFISLYETFTEAKGAIKITTEWVFNKTIIDSKNC